MASYHAYANDILPAQRLMSGMTQNVRATWRLLVKAPADLVFTGFINPAADKTFDQTTQRQIAVAGIALLVLGWGMLFYSWDNGTMALTSESQMWQEHRLIFRPCIVTGGRFTQTIVLVSVNDGGNGSDE